MCVCVGACVCDLECIVHLGGYYVGRPLVATSMLLCCIHSVCT